MAHDLVLDYGYVAPLTPAEVLPYAAALIVSCALVGWLWFAKPRAGLPFVLCLVLLAPTTLVPIISEVGAERRMYLPSLVLISAMLVYAWQIIPRKILIAISAVLIGALAVTSVKRNAEYSSTYEMWRTVVDRRPHGRAHLNLAVAANESGRTDEVLPLLRKAVVDFPDAEHPLGERLYQERALCGSDLAPRERFCALRPTHFQAEAAKQLLDQELDRPGYQGKRGRPPVPGARGVRPGFEARPRQSGSASECRDFRPATNRLRSRLKIIRCRSRSILD